MINPTNRSRNSCIFQIRNHNIFCRHFPVASVEQIEVNLSFVKPSVQNMMNHKQCKQCHSPVSMITQISYSSVTHQKNKVCIHENVYYDFCKFCLCHNLLRCNYNPLFLSHWSILDSRFRPPP